MTPLGLIIIIRQALFYFSLPNSLLSILYNQGFDVCMPST